MCKRIQGSQIFKQNWIISIYSRVIVIFLIWVSLALGVGQVGGGCPGWSTIVYMSWGMFRGKESLNRIELSQLVQDLLNFAVLGSLWLWGGGRWVGGVWEHLAAWGVSSHACTCTCTHTHVYMYRNCKWLLTWRHPFLACLASLTCMCVCVCMCVHVCACICMRACMEHPSTHPYPYPPPPHPPIHEPPKGGPPEWVKIW